jgi:hypothetical protein
MTIGWAGWLSTHNRKDQTMPQAATVDHEQVGNGDNGHKVGFDALLESTQGLQTTIRELLAKTGRIITGLKMHHRSMKTVRDAFAGLRQIEV